jgi:hypothetical protein
VCGPLNHHGYEGIEGEVAEIVARFIDSPRGRD